MGLRDVLLKIDEVLVDERFTKRAINTLRLGAPRRIFNNRLQTRASELKTSTDSKVSDVVFYTALIGKYDRLPDVSKCSGRFVCFTDRPRSAPGWEFVRITSFFHDPKISALYIKCNPHVLFGDAILACWVDSSFKSLALSEDFVRQIAADSPLAAIQHTERTSVAEEIREVRNQGLDSAVAIGRLQRRQVSSNFPDDQGLSATMFVTFDLRDSRVRDFCAAWWSLVSRTTRRDQLSFDFAAWSHGVPVKQLPIRYTEPTEFWVPGSHSIRAARIRHRMRFALSRSANGLPEFRYQDFPLDYPAVEMIPEESFANGELKVIRALNSVAASYAHQMEGNYFHTHGSVPHEFLPPDPRRSRKREVLRQIARRSNCILEVGFNAGHSASLMLAQNGTSQYLGIDVGEHSYSRPCARELESCYAGRVVMHWGDSKIVLYSLRPEQVALVDLVHIDGGHSLEAFQSDLEWFLVHCKSGTTLVVDDAYSRHIAELLEERVLSGDLRVEQIEGTSEVSVFQKAV